MAYRISFNYKNPLESQSFNNLIYRAIPAGIYDGFILSKTGGTSDTNVDLTTGTFVIESANVSELVSVKITSDAVIGSIPISSAAPYIVFSYDWANSTGNEPAITNKAFGSILATDIVVGKGNFSGSTLVDFDYTESPRYQSTYVGSDVEFGSISVSNPSGSAIELTSDINEFSDVQLRSNNLNRWVISKTGDDELGSDSGANFKIFRYDDLGSSLGTSVEIERATGQITFPTNIASSSPTTGALVVGGGIGIDGAAYLSGNLISLGDTILQQNLTGNSILRNECGDSSSIFHQFFKSSDGLGFYLQYSPTSDYLRVVSTDPSGVEIQRWEKNKSTFQAGIPVEILNPTNSTSKDTGALVITAGGLGVEGNIYSGGQLSSGTSGIVLNSTFPMPAMFQDENQLKQPYGFYGSMGGFNVDLTYNWYRNLAGTVNTLQADTGNDDICGIELGSQGLRFKAATTISNGAPLPNSVFRIDFNGNVTANGYIDTANGGGEQIEYRTSAGSETTTVIKKKIIEIGDWNMDTTSSVNVVHGITNFTSIKIESIMIIDDASTVSHPLLGGYPSGGVAGQAVSLEGSCYRLNSSVIILTRVNGSTFDSTSFDSTSFNRGYITISYEV